MNIFFHSLLLSLVLLFSFDSSVQAASIKVLKAKGGKAIVSAEGIRLQPGETYQLSSGDAVALDDVDPPMRGGSASGRRKYLINVSGGLNIFKNTPDNTDPDNYTKTTQLTFSARFGWNIGKMEYGPIVSYGNEGVKDEAGTSVSSESSFAGGAFFDYNFKPNRSGIDQVFGFGAEAQYGSTNDGTGAVSTLFFAGGPFFKWFLGVATAIRIDGKFNYETGGGAVTSGPELEFGISSYF